MNIRNLKIAKEKIISLALAGALTLSLSSCGTNKGNMSSISVNDLISLEMVRDITEIDDLQDTSALRYNGSNIVAQTDKLERYMNIVDSLSVVDFTEADELSSLTEEECEAVCSLTDEKINELIKDAQDKGKPLATVEKRINALRQLHYLKKHCDAWIRSCGQDISIEFMIASVKSSVANELDVDYSKITIPASYGSGEPGEKNYSVEVDGTTYRVSPQCDEICNTINYIYTLQSANAINDKTRLDTFRKAIDYGKTTIAAGCNLKNNMLEEQYDTAYIKTNILAK